MLLLPAGRRSGTVLHARRNSWAARSVPRSPRLRQVLEQGDAGECAASGAASKRRATSWTGARWTRHISSPSQRLSDPDARARLGQSAAGLDRALPPQEQLAEIREWFAAVPRAIRSLDFVEVVNEPLHDPPNQTRQRRRQLPRGARRRRCDGLGLGAQRLPHGARVLSARAAADQRLRHHQRSAGNAALQADHRAAAGRAADRCHRRAGPCVRNARGRPDGHARRESRCTRRDRRCRSTSRSSTSTAPPTRCNCRTINGSSRLLAASGSARHHALGFSSAAVAQCPRRIHRPRAMGPSVRRCGGCSNTFATRLHARNEPIGQDRALRCGASMRSSRPVRKCEKLAEGFTWAEGPAWIARAATCCSPTCRPIRSTAGRAADRPVDLPETIRLRRPGSQRLARSRRERPHRRGRSLDTAGRFGQPRHRTTGARQPAQDDARHALAGRRFNSPNDLVRRGGWDDLLHRSTVRTRGPQRIARQGAGLQRCLSPVARRQGCSHRSLTQLSERHRAFARRARAVRRELGSAATRCGSRTTWTLPASRPAGESLPTRRTCSDPLRPACPTAWR